MKTTKRGRVSHAILCLLLLVICLLPCGIKMQKEGGMSALTAAADSFYNPEIDVEQYDVHMRVRADRKIEVYEQIRVHFLDDDLTMFYRSLPTDGARYEDIVARCEGNDEFYFYVADNEEGGPFIDINCVGNADLGRVWTYEITYLMEQGVNTVEDGMIIDVVGFGWMVPLNNVSVTVDFPEKPTSTQVYTDVFGDVWGNKVTETWLNETTLFLKADHLELGYSDRYGETVAGGITLQFTLPEGVLADYHTMRMFTQDMWKIVLGVAIAVILSLLVAVLTGSKRELVTVVNLSPPKGMDPMKMGKWIDGTVNQEDITSMIYYFADKGYLSIDFTDQDDPKLITAYDGLPETAPPYAKTLFDGLFDGAVWGENSRRAVKVSELAGKFYESSRIATKQTPDTPPVYEMKSTLRYLCGPILGLLLGVILPFIVSFRIGGGYRYLLGVAFLAPLAINAFLGYVIENYRYKWKKWLLNLFVGIELIVAVIFTLLFVFLIGNHVATEFEKLAISAIAFGAAFATKGLFSRTEQYCQTLGHILGFKEFIVVTEEDKIKFMLQENPELYFKILPYAQVLGVTNEWESKFANITIQPPTWCTGDWTVFDYMLVNRCMRTAMITSMRSPDNSGGRGIGGTGGGGSFGGFGGGGFGGGGFGTR